MFISFELLCESRHPKRSRYLYIYLLSYQEDVAMPDCFIDAIRWEVFLGVDMHSLREAVHSSFDRKKKGCVQTCRLLPKGARHLWSHIKCPCQTAFDSKSPTIEKWRLPLNDVLFVWGLHSVIMCNYDMSFT